MPRVKFDRPRSQYLEDQKRLDELEIQLDKVVEALLDDPFNSELNSERRRLEIKILALTGEAAIYINDF